VGGRIFSSGERGSTIVEFAVVAALFFMILISIIEFSRLLYTHNALTDAARRGARYAALNKEADAACVKNVVIYGESHVDKNNGCAATGSPLINHLEDTNIDIKYEGADTDNDPDDLIPIDTMYGTNLGTVTVTVENFNFNLLVPYMGLQLAMPAYTTTLTSESAGTEPDEIVAP
jgi:hypothetical protein